METTPKTMQEAIQRFGTFENCKAFMVALRWPNGVTCPRCGAERVSFLAKARVWKCYEKHGRPTFTLKTGTIFEDSPIPLEKWLPAVWLLVSCKNGISSYEIHRGLGVTQKTAWFMLQRIRLAMQTGSFVKMGGPGSEVEVDETYIGGKARFMHASKKTRMRQGSHYGKTVVQGLLNRHGEVRLRVIGKMHHQTMVDTVLDNVERGTNIYSDEAMAYRVLNNEGYEHQFVNHAEKYVNGKVHTNGLENFWSLLKRSLKGTYVSVEPFHLFRYVDEQAFRFNNRKDEDGDKLNDSDRFENAMSQIVGKRLTFAEVTGKVGETRATN